MLAKRMKVKVSMRALMQRINRKLRPDEQLRRGRGEHRGNVGEFYIIDYRINAIQQPDVDPEVLGRKLGVLKNWEEVA